MTDSDVVDDIMELTTSVGSSIVWLQCPDEFASALPGFLKGSAMSFLINGLF